MQKRFHLTACFFLMLVTFARGQTPIDSTWFENYFDRSNTKREYNDKAWDDSLELIKEIAESKNYQPAISRYHITRATRFLSLQQPDSAIASFKTAIDLAEKQAINIELGNACLGLANLYEFSGNTLEAAVYYLKATKLLKDKGKKRTLIGLHRNLYSIFIRLQQKNIALENMLHAIKTSGSKEADLIRIINATNNEKLGIHPPDQSLVKELGANTIYAILGNGKFVIRNFETLSNYGSMREVQRIPAGTISQIPDFPINGSILMENNGDPKVYIIKDSMLYHIANTDVLEVYGGWDAVYFTPKGSLSTFPKSDQMVTLTNVHSIFNLKQEFDNLTDSIKTALTVNSELSNDLSRAVAKRNDILQKRKALLWASVIGLSSLLFILFLLLRNFRQKQKINAQSIQTLRTEQELQRKADIEKERTRIATDMHDDLGAGLSRIKFLSETINFKQQQHQPIEEDITKIRDYSHEMIDKMGEIVWALNEKNDSLNDLLSYTRAYAMEYLSQNGIECKVNMPDKIPEIIVAGEFRRNIYLAVKESLHNIVKHAAAKNVFINFKAEPDLIIVIRDDGIGFRGNAKAFTNGLSNMEKRMSSINGSFSIENNNGTAISLKAPVSW